MQRKIMKKNFLTKPTGLCGDRLCLSESTWCAYLGEYWYAFWLFHKNSNFVTMVIMHQPIFALRMVVVVL